MQSSRFSSEVPPGSGRTVRVKMDDFNVPVGTVTRANPPARAGYRLLILAALVPAGVVLGISLRRDPSARPTPQPLDFKLVEKRYGEVRPSVSRKEVEQWLGPPTERDVLAAELRQAEVQLDSGRFWGRPSVPVWDRWSDPNDKRRWVAVLYDGYAPSDSVRLIHKKGCSQPYHSAWRRLQRADDD